MSSVNEEQAGVASGINNAVSRAGGLLAIAVLGVVMLQGFSHRLEQRLASIEIPETARASLYQQRIKLTGLDVPDDLDSVKRAEVEQAVKDSYVSGFRMILLIAAALALAGALSTWLLIEDKKP